MRLFLNHKSFGTKRVWGFITLNILSTLYLIPNVSAQIKFRTIEGRLAKYSIEVPQDYYLKDAIGRNVDLKYANKDGASIVTVVRILPTGSTEDQIDNMAKVTNQQILNQFRAGGKDNIIIIIIHKGLTTINNTRTFFLYYLDEELYYHVITQYRKGKIITLTFTCPYSKKGIYMPYINRVSTSLKYL